MTRRQVAFTVWFIFLFILVAAPPIFGWSNRLDPRILGLSFAIAWQLILAAVVNASLIVWYFMDDRSGDLDIEVVVQETSQLGATGKERRTS